MKNLVKISSLLLQFMLAGFAGWVYETVLTSVVLGEFVDRGVLPLPILPIYGFFAVFMSVVFPPKMKWYNVLLISTIGTTIFEYIAALITERIFGYMLWDYFMWPLNFQGRISLFSSLIFGILSVLFVKAVKPFAEWLHSKFPKASTAGTFLLFCAAAVYCLIKLK